MNLTRLQDAYNQNKALLNSAIANHDQKMITFYRGKLIRSINRLLTPRVSAMLSATEISDYQTELTTELENHRVQLNYRIEHDKRDKQEFSISNEVGLKIRKTANSISRIGSASTGAERANAVLATAGNTLSTIFSMSKFIIRPAGFVVQKASGGTAYLTGCVVGFPVDVMVNLFGSLINPDRTVAFTITKKFSGAFKDVTEQAIGAVNDAVIRM